MPRRRCSGRRTPDALARCRGTSARQLVAAAHRQVRELVTVDHAPAGRWPVPKATSVVAAGTAVRGVTAQVLAEVQRAIAAQSEALRTAVAADAPGSPLQRLRADLGAGLNESHRRLAGQVTDLRTALEVDKATTQATAAAAAKTPTHGLDYETATLNQLEQLAYAAGDTLTTTGTTPGVIPRRHPPSPHRRRGHRAGPQPRAARPHRPPRHRNQRPRPTHLTHRVGNWTRPGPPTAAPSPPSACSAAPSRCPAHPVGCTTCQRPSTSSPTTPPPATTPTCSPPPTGCCARAWAAGLEDHGDPDIDLPALRAGLADALQALSGLETPTKHSASARKQLDDLDKATTTLRTNLRTRLETTLRLLDPAQPAAPAQETAAA